MPSACGRRCATVAFATIRGYLSSCQELKAPARSRFAHLLPRVRLEEASEALSKQRSEARTFHRTSVHSESVDLPCLRLEPAPLPESLSGRADASAAAFALVVAFSRTILARLFLRFHLLPLPVVSGLLVC